MVKQILQNSRYEFLDKGMLTRESKKFVATPMDGHIVSVLNHYQYRPKGLRQKRQCPPPWGQCEAMPFYGDFDSDLAFASSQIMRKIRIALL